MIRNSRLSMNGDVPMMAPVAGSRSGPQLGAVMSTTTPSRPRKLAWVLLAGAAIAGFRVRFGVRWMTRLLRWAERKKPEFAARKWYDPKRIYTAGLTAIRNATSGIEDPYIQGGVQTAGVAYFTGSAGVVVVFAGYALVAVFVAIAMIFLILWGIGKAMEN